MIAAVYFSPTGNSRRSAVALAEAWAAGAEIGRVDLTDWRTSWAPRSFAAEDFVVFAAPVYAGRLPDVSLERFRSLRGQQTPCVVAVTYGNRHYDDALLELTELVTAQGFQVRGAAALVGRHTYGDIQPERPDEDDRVENEAFVARLQALPAAAETPVVPGKRPYQAGGRGKTPFIPETDYRCSHCGLCVRKCPMGAIADDCVSIDAARCISCFRCIRGCKLQAKRAQGSAYENFAAMLTKKLAVRRENEYFLPNDKYSQ